MPVEPLLGTRAQKAFIITSVFSFRYSISISQLTALCHSRNPLVVRLSFHVRDLTQVPIEAIVVITMVGLTFGIVSLFICS